MTASAPVKAETPALDGDEDDDMEDVSMGPRNAVGSSTAAAVPAESSATDKGEEDDFEETLKRYEKLKTLPGVRQGLALRGSRSGRLLLRVARPAKRKLLGS